MGAIGAIFGAGMSAAAAGANGAAASPSIGALGTPGATGAIGATGAPGTNFGDVVMGALDNLGAVQGTAENLAVKAATGDLNDVQDYMIAAAQAGLATQFTVALRDRAVEAFNDIMKMQV